MKAGLFPFGTDFGNGEREKLFFQVDDERGRYLEAKAAVPPSRHLVLDEPALAPVHDAALSWLYGTFEREHPGLISRPSGSVAEQYARFCLQIQEDLCVIHRGDGTGRVLVMNVCFPSGWRPDALSGANFMRIHEPVPSFAAERLGRSMIEAMIDRGPYVRFVWTVAADDFLDHHPEQGRREKWSPTTQRGWLRLERQVTIPLKQVDASIFLIRSYLYPLASLTPEQRVTLKTALQLMPDEIARYKSLYDGRARMIELLG